MGRRDRVHEDCGQSWAEHTIAKLGSSSRLQLQWVCPSPAASAAASAAAAMARDGVQGQQR